MSVYDLNDMDNLQPVSQEEPAPVPAALGSGKKKHTGLWVLIVLLLAALAAEPFVLAALREEPAQIIGAQINKDGELVLSYSDGSEDNLGVVVGKDGEDGKDGMDGSGAITVNGCDVSAATAKGLRSAVSVFCTFNEQDRRGKLTEYYSAGAGVIYQLDRDAGDAFVITNYHVVFDPDSRMENGIAEEIILYLYGSELQGLEIEASYVGGSQNYDIAVLRVEDSQVLKDSYAAAVTVGDSDAVRLGSTAIAIGNPEGMGIAASMGVVSVDTEHITMMAADGVTEVDYRVMRIDTAVNHGNSGGGLFDEKGQLIGIVNAKTIDDGVDSIGYALPTSTVTAVADNIIDYCFGTSCENVQRALLGVTVITTDTRGVYDPQTGSMDITEQVEILEVTPGGIGQVFVTGDILVKAELNGTVKQITRQHHMIDLLLTARPGDTVRVEVLRNGKTVVLELSITQDCLAAY